MTLKECWSTLYRSVPEQLEKLQQIPGVLSVFNSNIDAVIHLTPALFSKLCNSADAAPEKLSGEGNRAIANKADLLRGFAHCFSKGIAQEWLISDPAIADWLAAELPERHLQMGGQGGIIANVMSTCEVQQVLVHGASLPAEQCQLFVDRDNLLTATASGDLIPARSAGREATPLVHWILEFQKGDTIQIGENTFTCPKANRFIATYDPHNFNLHIDEAFDKAVQDHLVPLDYCLLAGYHMLQARLADGSTAAARISESRAIVDRWRAQHPAMQVHFEFASTADVAVRRELLSQMAPWADSIGLNEQELIDLLEISDEQALAVECKTDLSAVPLFRGLLALFEKMHCPRVQLHLFGLYITLLSPEHLTSAEKTRSGMMLAASIAAAKAGTGSIDRRENLLWATATPVADHALMEFTALSEYLTSTFGIADFAKTGIGNCDSFTVVATPTILIDKPVTLVGMGDTISSLSLVGAR